MPLFGGKPEEVQCAECGRMVQKVTPKAKARLWGKKRVGTGFTEMALRCSDCSQVLCVTCLGASNPLTPSGVKAAGFVRRPRDLALVSVHLVELLVEAGAGRASCPSCKQKSVGLFECD